ncbi:hypothetical protein Acr_18g0007340 [Actinidia rufa]|uniref:Retrotransposon gag domain-containing protein n=1 Tax=Actinidia rufa TaxID=165716 RepID=A0A7J0G6Y8_9ERIC|nr:hypothetical protein Acr_18g0007340 [Actinidia rufa]
MLVAHPKFLPQQFGIVCENDSSQLSMHLRSHLLSRPSTNNPLDNIAHPMANTSQAPDLEGIIHHEMHGIVEQIKIMNKINARLVQYLATNNPHPFTAPILKDVDRSRHSHRSGDQDSQNHHSTDQENSTRRRGRSPHQDDQAHRHRDKSITPKIKDLNAWIDAINTSVKALVTMDTLIRQIESPFTERVMKVKEPTRSWFKKLSPKTLDSFGNLDRIFVANFMSCRVREKNTSHFFTVHQKDGKSLKNYIMHFNQTVLEVEDHNDKVVVMAMMEGLRPSLLFDSLSKSVHLTLSAL